MKTNPLPHHGRQGSVLVITMTIVVLGTILLTSALMLVQNQTATVAWSQTWNSAVPVAEAGLEEGYSLINQGAPVNSNGIIANAWAWTNSIPGQWSSISNNQISLTRYVSGSNYYTVTVSNISIAPVVTAVGVVSYTSIPWIFSSGSQPFLAAAGLHPLLAQTVLGSSSSGSSSTSTVGRKLQVQSVLSPLFSAAVVTKSNFNMNGNNTLVDSFNSTPGSSNNILGQWAASVRSANGNVGTDSSIIGDISIGNGNIYGHVMTGPGTIQTDVQIGPNGAVGDLGFQNAGDTGIETNYWSGDFNVNIPDVPAPATGNSTVPPTVNGYIPLTGGNYTWANDPGTPLLVSAPTTVWVQGGFSSGIVITNSGTLTLYVGNTSGSGVTLDMSGNGSMNSPGYAANFQIYGLPTLTLIKFAGNAQVAATIYAPEASVQNKGGGKPSDALDTSGAIIAAEVVVNGHWNFHYDQALTNTGPSRGWIATNWVELKYP